MDDLPFGRLWAGRFPVEPTKETQRFWDLRASEFNDITRDNDRMERMDLIHYLADRGALDKNTAVLDLGCGAGRFALEFGRTCRAVTGLDISPQMIAHARANAKEAGLDNISFLAMPWQGADLDALGFRAAFDLVFASMSPAINSEASLLDMHRASRGFCFLSGFIHREDLLERRLARRIRTDLRIPRLEGSIYYAFNVLWQHGIHADLTCKDVAWSKLWTVEHAVEVYAKQLAPFLEDVPNLREALTRYAAEEAVGGVLERQMAAKVAWLFWKREPPSNTA